MEFTKEELANEEWRDVVGYEGKYQVSNLGRVKNSLTLKVLKNSTNRGYQSVGLYSMAKKRQLTYLVHRLVALSFIENPNGLMVVNHKDENRSNNRVGNLEWCDNFYNNSYGTKNERMLKTRVANKTQTAPRMVAQYDMDGNFINLYESLHEAGRRTNSDYRAIFTCCKGGGMISHRGYVWRYIEDTSSSNLIDEKIVVKKSIKPYKVKHIPTGLYFQPNKNGNNLSPRGKVYLTETNPCNRGMCDLIRLSIKEDSIVYDKTKDIIPWQKATWTYGVMYYHAPKSDFQIEEL